MRSDCAPAWAGSSPPRRRPGVRCGGSRGHPGGVRCPAGGEDGYWRRRRPRRATRRTAWSIPDGPLPGLDGVIGFRFTEVSGDRVEGRLPVTPTVHQPFGLVHGGAYCTVVETTASIGGSVWFGDRGRVVGTSNHTNFLRGVSEGVLDVVGEPVHRGRTSQLWTVRITDEQGRLVAKGDVALANLPHRD